MTPEEIIKKHYRDIGTKGGNKTAQLGSAHYKKMQKKSSENRTKNRLARIAKELDTSK